VVAQSAHGAKCGTTGREGGWSEYALIKDGVNAFYDIFIVHSITCEFVEQLRELEGHTRTELLRINDLNLSESSGSEPVRTVGSDLRVVSKYLVAGATVQERGEGFDSMLRHGWVQSDAVPVVQIHGIGVIDHRVESIAGHILDQ